MNSSVDVIIPTYRRPTSVVSHTIRSILEDESARHLIRSIIVIDQNENPLNLDVGRPSIKMIQLRSEECRQFNPGERQVVHVYGLSPSVTRAKNLGRTLATGDILVFFDDDVTVLPGTIAAYVKCFIAHPEIGYLGGREIPESAIKQEQIWKRILRGLLQPLSTEDSDYRFNGHYIGRIKPNSIMLSNFNVAADRLIRIDGARGCNWACRKFWFDQSGGFDENFNGNSLREETDLYIRLNKIGAQGWYTAESAVIHHRQMGGCNNLSQSVSSFRSKIENDFYFQSKHFRDVPRLFFIARTAPMMLENFIETQGQSFWVWFKYWFKRF